MPPACAMAIAILASVTVSMAEATTGIFSVIPRVMRVRISTSDGSTSDSPGLSSTSSKVKASGNAELPVAAIAKSIPPAGGCCGCRMRYNRTYREEHAILAQLGGPLYGWRWWIAFPLPYA